MGTTTLVAQNNTVIASTNNSNLFTMATGCRLNPYFDETIRYACVENRFIVHAEVYQIAIRIANAYMDITSGNEITTGSIITVGAAIQDTSGTWLRFVDSSNGSATLSVEQLTTLQSALCARKCVIGELISVRFDITCPTGLPYTHRCYTDPIAGSTFEYSTSAPLESCLTGRTLFNTTDHRSFFPINIIGPHAEESIATIGDSKCMGIADANVDSVANMAYAVGSIGRAIFERKIPHINMGLGSDSIGRFLGCVNSLRLAELEFVSNIVVQHIHNDEGRTTEELAANAKEFMRLLPANKGIYFCTSSPVTTGAWSLADASDQTVNGNLSKRTFWFDFIKRIKHAAGTIAIDFAHMSAENSNKWKPGMTNDGIHENGYTANMLVARSGVINGIEFKKAGFVAEKPDYPYVTIFDGSFSTGGAKALTLVPGTFNYCEFISGNPTDGYTTQIHGFSKTVVAGDTIVVRTRHPESISNITWTNKALLGNFLNLDTVVNLTTFNIGGGGNNVNYSEDEIANLAKLTTITAHVLASPAIPSKIPKMYNLKKVTSVNFNNSLKYGNVPDLSNCAALTSFSAGTNITNGGIVGWDGGSFPITLKTFTLAGSGAGMTSETKNAMLAAFLAASVAGATDMNITFSAGLLATGQGIIDKAALISAGHTVTNA